MEKGTNMTIPNNIEYAMTAGRGNEDVVVALKGKGYRKTRKQRYAQYAVNKEENAIEEK